MRPQIPGINLG